MQQQQHFPRTDNDISIMNYRDAVSSSVKYDNVQVVTVHQLKQIFDDFIQLSSFSSRDLIEKLDLLDGIDDKQLLTDALLINHKIYSILTFMLKDLLNKWHTVNSLTQFELSYLFSSLIKFFCKMNSYSTDLVEPLRKCLNDIAKHGRYLDSFNDMEHFSNLVKLYIQDEPTMNAIINCLCLHHYLNMFEQTEKVEKFLLFICPRYFQDYQGPQKKEMKEKLFNIFGKSAAQLLRCYPKTMDEPLLELFHILNHRFQLCTTVAIFDTDQLLPLLDGLLLILDEKPSSLKENSWIIRYSLNLLRTFTNKNEAILKYVQQREDASQKLKEFNCNSDANVLPYITTPFCHQKDEQNNINVSVASTITSEVIIDSHQVPNTFSSSTFASNVNQNKEEITLIWCDQNNDVHEDAKEIVELLQQVNDYVLVFSNADTCLEYINKIQTEKVFLILSGQAADDMIDKVDDLKQIDSIYIFCMDNVRYEHYLKEDHKKYYKIIGLYTEHESLLRAIQENIRYMIKQLQVTSLFEQFGRSIRGLNCESHGFDVFRAFKYVLFRTYYDTEHAKREMIEVCRNYYRGNRNKLKYIDEFEQTYNSSNAIKWYTRPIFLYELVNKALRTEDYEVLLAFRFYIIDLCNNLRLKYDELKQDQQRQGLSIIVTYRGVRLALSDIYNLKHNIGKTIATNGFLSTSRLKYIAEIFAGVGGSKEPGLERVMLEFHVDTTKLTTTLADIATYSEIPDEEEVLFDLGASFVIENVTHDDLGDVWWVKLSAESEDIVTNNVQILLKSCGETEMNLLLGELLIKMGLYSTCRKYLKSLFNLYGDGHEHVANIEKLTGETYEFEGIYDQAILHYMKAFDLYASLNQWIDASRVIIWTAVCHYAKQDKIIMRQCIEKAYEILKNKTSLPDEHCQYGDVKCLYGMMEDNHQTARNHFMEALDIYKNALTVCKCNDHNNKIVQVYENIGVRYRDEENYTQTRIYFQESEKIRSKNIIFGRERKAYATCLQVITGCYNFTKERIMAEKYMVKLYEFIDTDLIKVLYEDNSNVQEAVIKTLVFINNFDNVLLHEMKLLHSLEKIQPLDYEMIIERHLNIGEIYNKTNDNQWAHEHYDKACELCETHISSKDQQAQYLFNIGHRLLIDDIDYASKFVRKALETRLSVLKYDDVNIAFSHYDMSIIYEHNKEFDNAIEHLQKAIDIFEKHLNDEQNYQFNIKEQCAECYQISASMYETKTEFRKSIEYLTKAANIIERFFSDISDNYCTLAKYYKMIASNYYQLLDYDTSIKFYKKYLETIEKHPEEKLFAFDRIPRIHHHASEISNAFNRLGSMYYEKMDRDQSIFYYEKFIKSAPANQNSIALSFGLIGNCYMNQKCYEKAIEKYEKAAVHYESQLPSKLDLYAECVRQIASCYFQLGKNHCSHAIDYILKAIKIHEQNDARNRNELAFCYLFYSAILAQKGQYVSSIEIANQILALQIEDEQLMAKAQYLLSFCFYEKDDYQTSLTYAKLSMEIYREFCPELNDEDSANTYFLTARCFLRLNNLNEALLSTLKYQEIIDKLNPILNIKKAISYSLLALVYSKQHEYEKSSSCRKTALNTSEQLIKSGDKLDDIGRIFEDIGELFMSETRFDKAREYYQKALTFYKQELVDDHPKLQSLQSIINLCRRQRSNNDAITPLLRSHCDLF